MSLIKTLILLPLFHGQNVEQGDRSVRRGSDLIEQAQEVAGHSLHRGRFEQRRVVFEAAGETALHGGEGKTQIELGHRRSGGERRYGEAGKGQRSSRRPVEREADLKDRVAIPSPWPAKGVHHLFKRRLLIGVGFERVRARPPQQSGKTGTAGKIAAHHQHVHEESDQRLEFLPVAIGYRRADRHRNAPAIAMQ